MADEPKKDEAPDEAGAPRSKRNLLLGGGILGLVGLAYVMATMAVPAESGPMPFEGPYVIGLSELPLNVNLSKDGGKRFMQLTIKAQYLGYDEEYATQRVADPLYLAELQDSLISVGRRKSYSELEDPVGEEMFKQELRELVEPLLFPLHVGDPEQPYARDDDSGLAPGRSIERSTFRLGYRDHALTVDAPARTIRLGDGPAVTFSGDEDDLVVTDAEGRTIHVDVTELDPSFQGEVRVGTFGKVHAVLFGKFIIQ